ncbi:MAG: DMT family transporter [Clostridiales bacterium]|jgi:drug/metabolite transporter (DMT)-like permease|nr:DMT family transporter [Clostridiales bacterium]
MSGKERDRKGPPLIVAASVCWSIGGLCIKFIPWGAMSIIGLRSLIAALVFILIRRSVKIAFTRGNILAAVSLSLTMTLFVFANKLTTAAAAILLQFSSPIFIILMHLFFYRKKPRLSELAAVLVTLCGMVLFFLDRLEAGSVLGNLLAIASGVAFAGVFVCNRRADTQPEQAQLLGFLLNAAVGVPFAFFEVTADPVSWGFLLLLGTVQVGLAYYLFSAGIKTTPALLACLITALEPVLNPLWVALATGEVPGRFAAAGGAVIVITVVVYNIWAEKKSLAT